MSIPPTTALFATINVSLARHDEIGPGNSIRHAARELLEERKEGCQT